MHFYKAAGGHCAFFKLQMDWMLMEENGATFPSQFTNNCGGHITGNPPAMYPAHAGASGLVCGASA